MGASVLLWFGLCGLMVISRADPEALLRKTFGRFSRPDAFEHLNGISALLWIAHTSLILIAITTAEFRRPDVFIVLSIGPVIGSMIGLLAQDWADPNWFQVVAISTIGWLASIVVGAAYWALRPTAGPA